MNIIIITVLLILTMFLVLYTKNIITVFLILVILNLYFPPYISIGGLQISTTFNFLSLLAICYFLTKKIARPNLKELYLALSYLGLLVFWSIINGTFLSSTQIFGFKRTLGIFSVASFCFFALKDQKQITKLHSCLIFFLYILTTYGIFCYLTQSNIILTAINLIFNPTDNILESFSNEVRGGLEGRIQGFCTHPLAYGGILIVSFFYILYFMNLKKNKYISIGLLILIFINIFLCGSRSALIALGAGIFIYFFILGKFKIKQKIYIIAAILTIYFILFISSGFLTQYQEYINSIIFFWENNNEVKGSNFDMRLNQLDASFSIISTDPITFLFGKGDKWCLNYSMTHGGLHPQLLGFESILFIGLIEYGVIGFVIITCGLYFKLLFFNKKYGNSPIIQCFIITFFIFQFFTGDYAWLPFLCIVMLMIKAEIIYHKQLISNENNIHHCTYI